MQKNNLSKRAITNAAAMIGLALLGSCLAFWAAPYDYPFIIKVIGALWFAYLLFYQIEGVNCILYPLARFYGQSPAGMVIPTRFRNQD